MNKIYTTSKGQLLTLWVFGALMAIWAMMQSETSSNPIYGILWIGVPAALVFYTIGWLDKRDGPTPLDKFRRDKLKQD